ncbi:MAG: hypothetical protein ACOWWR_18515 [Eubacteriales bacterium]
MATAQWHRDKWSNSGCAGTYQDPGWYMNGQLVTADYKNPNTGKAYTVPELEAMVNGSAAVTTGSNIVSAADNNHPSLEDQAQNIPSQLTPEQSAVFGKEVDLSNLNVPKAPDVPEYNTSPETQAWIDKMDSYISQGLEQGGYGIDEKTQNQMIQKQKDIIAAKEQESIRTLKNNLEARGLSDSGYEFDKTMEIKAQGTIALADSITDIQIQNSMIKLASFEKMMGLGAQMISVLSEESWRKYQPKMLEYQANVDLYKQAIGQAYTEHNMELAYQYDSMLQQQNQEFEQQMFEMKIEASQEAAKTQGWGQIIGQLIMLPLMLLML